jgi:hypothetical protein
MIKIDEWGQLSCPVCREGYLLHHYGWTRSVESERGRTEKDTCLKFECENGHVWLMEFTFKNGMITVKNNVLPEISECGVEWGNGPDTDALKKETAR